MSLWCDNPRDHERQGERDFERNGRYGYDSQQYNDHWNDCSKHYREGFDNARREDERRQEAYEEQQAENRRQDQADRRRRQEAQEEYERQEDEYYRQQQEEQYPEPEPFQELRQWLHARGWSRKQRLDYLRRNKIQLP